MLIKIEHRNSFKDLESLELFQTISGNAKKKKNNNTDTMNYSEVILQTINGGLPYVPVIALVHEYLD